jgi:tRNA-specific 2-thiouridylase
MKPKVVIAMSGGVDSSVCALMMQNEGYDCVGMTMRLWKGPEAESLSCDSKSCCGAESVEDARLVCERIGIPYYAVNFRETFWKEVVERFANEYCQGKTPSPCILCNEKMKFDTLYKKCLSVGAAKVCTGHYSKIYYDDSRERWILAKGEDHTKDQSYFLFSMTQEQLSKTLFPLGSYKKTEIRQMAAEAGLINAKKPESMDICFIPNGDYAAFIERHFPDKIPPKGHFKHTSGQDLGEHKGIHSYTVGQRKGLNLAFGQPLYVSEIDPQTHTVTVGSYDDSKKTRFTASRVNWVAEDGSKSQYEAKVKIRSRSPEADATIYPLENGTVEVVFSSPQHAITPGQATVFYQGDEVLGGGWID